MKNFKLVVEAADAGFTVDLLRPSEHGYAQLVKLDVVPSTKTISWNALAGALKGSRSFDTAVDHYSNWTRGRNVRDEDIPF